MKIEDYSPKAREDFGKSLVDIGVSIYKGLILLFTVIPISVLLCSGLSANGEDISIFTPFESMSNATYLTLMAFLVVAFLLGHVFRSAGLKHIHASEHENS